jgi:hypothetical protein
MANVTLQAVKTALQVAVTNSEGEQDTINLAAGGTVVLDSTIVARSQGIFAMVADGRLAVTSGSMPSAVFSDVSAPAPTGVKGALAVTANSAPTVLVDATDDATVWALANDLKAKYNAAVTLINELKTILNAMNA